ncbi:hypothetical protein R0381_000147 [Jeongeupia wiesaeckerbachi]|uniref:cytochrome oxidase putative small subunit CydP n=1 Tax=Jeongeupia wiesaeckerbachi TaxID=3051218 RepID=UPI003D809190
MKRRTGLPLWMEITIMLLIKCLLLYGAWRLWFSAPLAKKMTVPDAAISQQLLGQPAATETRSTVPGDNTNATRR